ncbi:unnamed protein product [Lactuca virosa]|uniref:Uncharacterized protein n=1 Tax=Lactuca virosa TaxID=75947 RepID=A0AAU9P397_9ASTR|nr:unnamed protein product [Lactuca virosa]
MFTEAATRDVSREEKQPQGATSMAAARFSRCGVEWGEKEWWRRWEPILRPRRQTISMVVHDYDVPCDALRRCRQTCRRFGFGSLRLQQRI